MLSVDVFCAKYVKDWQALGPGIGGGGGGGGGGRGVERRREGEREEGRWRIKT